MLPLIVAYVTKSTVLAFLIGSSIMLPMFAIMNWPLLHGRTSISIWSLSYFPLHIINGLYLMGGYRGSVKNLGQEHTNAVCSITALLFTALAVVGILGWRRSSIARTLAFHWIAWLWLILYLFPLLGPLFTLV